MPRDLAVTAPWTMGSTSRVGVGGRDPGHLIRKIIVNQGAWASSSRSPILMLLVAALHVTKDIKRVV